MKKAEIISLVGALVLVAAIFGGLFLAGRTSKEDTFRIKALEKTVEGNDIELADQNSQFAELTSMREEVTTDLERANSEILDLKTGLAKAESVISGLQEKERVRLAGREIETKGIVFSDRRETLKIEILRVLIGDQVWLNQKLHRGQVDDLRAQGKEAIYFELKVTNDGYVGEANVNNHRFKLESENGDTFSSDLSRDYIRGSIHMGRSTTGGIAFGIYTNAKPKLLRYDTGFTVDGVMLEAVSPNLSQIIPKSD